MLDRQLAGVERWSDLVALGYLSAICLLDNCWVIGSAVGWLLVLLCTTLDWLVTYLSLGSS